MITDEQKTKINVILSATCGLISRVEKGVILGQEVENFFTEQVRITKELFADTSDEWRIVDRWQHENNFMCHSTYKPGIYAGDKEKQKLLKLSEVLRCLMPTGLPMSSKNEFHFSKTEAYDAKRYICSLFRLAGSKLMIVDEYLDDQFFEYIDIVPDTVEIRIITGEQKTIFWTLISDLKKKKNNIEARVNNSSHCRYIVIDDSMIYSTDASLNTIGKKDFMIHKLEEANEISKVKIEIEGYWDSAKIK